MSLAQGMLPAWLVLPLAGVVLVVIATHVLSLQVQIMPSRRRRIRTACGLLMMFVAALIAYALTMLPEPTAGSDGRHVFVMVWTLIVGLLAMVVLLAAADAAHTLVLAFRARRELRDQFRASVQRDARTRAEQPGDAPRA